MTTVLWTTLAVATLAGMFAACVLVVVTGVRVLEGLLARRRGRLTDAGSM